VPVATDERQERCSRPHHLPLYHRAAWGPQGASRGLRLPQVAYHDEAVSGRGLVFETRPRYGEKALHKQGASIVSRSVRAWLACM
jgi:hypothetical protein